jgi:hypothetical protein
MRYLAITAICFFLIAITPATWANEWYLEKRLSTTTSTRLSGEDRLTTQVNAVGLKAEYNGERIGVRVNGEWQYDAVYDLHSQYSNAAKEEYRSRLWLDEAYFEWRFTDYDVSLGFQKVVWGQADDLRITDVINPLDLKNFVLFDIDEYRISLPMLRVETDVQGWQLQSLWILDTKPNQIPPEGSEFNANIPNLAESDTDDSEWGFKAEGFVAGTDIAFYAFRGYADTPIVELSTRGATLLYEKETMLGLSLARPIHDWVFRNEWAWFDQRAFNTQSSDVVNHDVLQWLVGLDYLHKDWLFTAQMTDHFIQDWRSNLAVEKREPFYTLSADTTLLSGNMNLRLALSHSEDAGSGQLYQIKASYRPYQSWEFRAHLDMLEGDTVNFFGQFNNKDRLWLSAAYTF